VELSGYFAVARRWWWTLLVAAWVAGLAGFYFASRIDPTYESQVKMLVGPINTDADTLRGAGLMIQTYGQVVTTDPILKSALDEVGLVIPTAALAANTRVTANDVTRILTIRVQAGRPELAASLANALAGTMITTAGQGTVTRPDGQLAIIQDAVPNPDPVAPQVSLIVLLATAAGILAAIVLVLLIEYLGRSIRSREELARLAGAPVLGSVPAPRRANPHPKDLVDESSSAATVYRVLAARIVYGDPTEILSSVAVVDAESDTGSAVVAMNLARALARLGRRVVLIDGGSRGGLAQLFGVDPAPGLREIMDREVQPRSAMRMIGERMALVPAGYEGGELIDPERAKAVLDDLSAFADVIVVATPPVQAGPAALSWARTVDGTVLVARRDHAKREDVSAASETLIHVGGNLIGTILAERPAPLSGLFGRGRSGSSRMVPVAPRSPTQMATQMAAATAASAAASYGPAPGQMATPVAPTLRPAIVRASAPVSPMPHVTTIGPVTQVVPAESAETSDSDETAEMADEDSPAAPAPKRSSTTTGRSATARSRSAGRSTTSRSGPNTTS
jgi:polysaccharide biosynthesis transport protein